MIENALTIFAYSTKNAEVHVTSAFFSWMILLKVNVSLSLPRESDQRLAQEGDRVLDFILDELPQATLLA